MTAMDIMKLKDIKVEFWSNNCSEMNSKWQTFGYNIRRDGVQLFKETYILFKLVSVFQKLEQCTLLFPTGFSALLR